VLSATFLVVLTPDRAPASLGRLAAWEPSTPRSQLRRTFRTACGAPQDAGGAHWFPGTITLTVPFNLAG